MSDRNAFCRYATGLCVLALGGTVLSGFVLRNEALVRLHIGIGVAVALNTAAALTLGGLVLLAPLWAGAAAELAGQALGAAISLLSLAVLAENLLRRPIGGLDAVSWHLWLGENNSAPGRMAPNTCLGLLCFGAAFVLLPRVRGGGPAIAVRLLTLGVAVIGAGGFLGYLFQFDSFYAWEAAMSMAPQTTAGLLVLGLGLWSSWRGCAWNESAEAFTSARRILSAATVSLLAVAVVAGMGMLFLLDHIERSNAVNDLTRRRDDRRLYLENVIAQRAALALSDAARPPAATLPLLQSQAAGLLNDGFSGVAYLDAANSPLVQAGAFQDAAPIVVALHLPGAPRLLWNQSYYLRVETRLAPAATALPGAASRPPVAAVRLETPVLLLDQLYAHGTGWGETGEMGLCGADGQSMLCFPQRLRQQAFTFPRTGDNQVQTMGLALDGGSGWTEADDYRGQRVLAAYAPVGATGLGLVMKMDLSELYAPVRRIFTLMLPLLALLILLGVAAMHWQLRRLLAELEASRNRALESEARFRAAVASSMDAFYILHSVRNRAGEIADFRLAYVNAIGERLLGFPTGRGLDHNVSGFARALGSGDFVAKFKHVIVTEQPLVEEFPMALRQGTRWLHHQVVSLGDGVAVTVRDITDRKNAEARLLDLARNDSLTGLANRATFLERLQAQIETAGRDRSRLALLYLDIDQFKLVNDTHGHAAGDRLLREFADRLLTCVRGTDLVARLGGDEFTILLPGVERPDDAERVVNAIVASLQPPFGLEGGPSRITVSIGAALCDHDDCTAERLLQQADAALYQVKRSGRNGFHLVSA